jgi:ribosome-binding protein aMBF1 (putative translation factor)
MHKDKYDPVPHNHEEILADLLKNPEFKKEYEALDEEYKILSACMKARKRLNLTQEEVAKRMKTSRIVVSRIESPFRVHSPTMNTVRKYAHALGCTLEIKLKPAKKKEGILNKRTSAHC